jgi:alpha-1,2-mannosyltransferase
VGLDFDVYRAAGNSVLHGTSVFDPALATSMRYPLPFTYPPLAALLAVPFALVGNRMGLALWDAVSVVALAFVVRAAARPLLRRQTRPILALTLAVLVALALTPVVAALDLGQVGIPLMAMCLFDCVLERPRWPRGVMIGIATAVKLLPGIFIPYLWLTGRRRAAATATAVAVACSLATFLILPHDSHVFWTEHVFDNSRVGNITYFSNQSLYGMARRALGAHTGIALVLWLPLAAVVVGFGLRHAVLASRRGQELLGVSMIALVGALVSPVSWVHHLVWIVPVLAVVIGDATDRRRVVLALSVAAWFVLRLPYLARSIPDGWGLAWLAGPLKDSYGLACLVLLFVLPRLVSARSPRAEPPRPARVVPSSS